jgi:hypothetical protein
LQLLSPALTLSMNLTIKIFLPFWTLFKWNPMICILLYACFSFFSSSLFLWFWFFFFFSSWFFFFLLVLMLEFRAFSCLASAVPFESCPQTVLL